MRTITIEELHEVLKNNLSAQEYIELFENMIKTVVKMGACADAKAE